MDAGRIRREPILTPPAAGARAGAAKESGAAAASAGAAKAGGAAGASAGAREAGTAAGASSGALLEAATVEQSATLSHCDDFFEGLGQQRLKSKWRDFKQFYNTDAPPENVGVRSKKGRLHHTKQLVSRTLNGLGSLEKGCRVQGRFMVFSSWDHRLHRVLSALGLHAVANLIDLTTDEVEGGVQCEVRFSRDGGKHVATRRAEADDEGVYRLDVAFTDDEKVKAAGAKELDFQVYFRGIRDEKDEHAHFNRYRDLDIPVGAGRIRLVEGDEKVTSSDIDKTILDTTIGPGYFFQEPWSRKFLPGAAAFFAAVDETLHTLSGSEQNVAPGILAAFELQGISPAGVDFKDWMRGEKGESLSTRKARLSEQVGFKITRELETDIHLSGAAKMRAHGDITEYDPVVYLLLHGILTGDLDGKTLTAMFGDGGKWPELAKVPEADRRKVVALSSLVGRREGFDVIAINIGSGNPEKPRLKNAHGFTLPDFQRFADRLEEIHPGRNFYRDRIIFTDNYLQTALYYRQMGDDRIGDDVAVKVGEDLIRRGFTPRQVGESLKRVIQNDKGQSPRRFLKRETVAVLLPRLVEAGVVPAGFRL